MIRRIAKSLGLLDDDTEHNDVQDAAMQSAAEAQHEVQKARRDRGVLEVEYTLMTQRRHDRRQPHIR